MSDGPGTHEALESYYERFENTTRFHCYERQDAVSCHDLGTFFETKKKKLAEALKIYKKNCFENNFGKSCWSYGEMMYEGRRGIEKDITEGLKGYLHGCNVKNYSGPTCDTIGQVLLAKDQSPEIQAVIGPRDVEKAGKMFIRGCEDDDRISCSHATALFNEGKHTKKDEGLAFQYAVKGCELNSAYCCTVAAKACKEGSGTDKNAELFEYYYKRAKALKPEARQVR